MTNRHPARGTVTPLLVAAAIDRADEQGQAEI
jgi:hypothetical protein